MKVLALTLLLAMPAAAQSTETAEMAPIECWWRTSANSARVGQLFRVILTCSVLETTSTTVVPDQSRLDPSVLQLPPFEVIGGFQAADLRTPSRRFFQYEYTLRYIGEDFGRDLALPQLPVSYRVQSRVDRNAAAIEGRDRQYSLPAQMIRIESLVPASARDIRDRPPDTFRDIEQRRFRAKVLHIIGLSLMVVSGAILVWALVNYVSRRRAKTTQRVRFASDGAVLREVGRQLQDVRRSRLSDGWTADLAARTLAALRIAGAYAVSGHATQSPLTRGAGPTEGQIAVRPPFQPGKAAFVSGSVTAQTVAREMRRRESMNGRPAAALVDLHQALQQFSTAAYGHISPSDEALDEAMAGGERAVSAVRREHHWAVRRMAALRSAILGARARAWAR